MFLYKIIYNLVYFILLVLYLFVEVIINIGFVRLTLLKIKLISLCYPEITFFKSLYDYFTFDSKFTATMLL